MKGAAEVVSRLDNPPVYGYSALSGKPFLLGGPGMRIEPKSIGSVSSPKLSLASTSPPVMRLGSARESRGTMIVHH